jgi:hypothetical protein
VKSSIIGPPKLSIIGPPEKTKLSSPLVVRGFADGSIVGISGQLESIANPGADAQVKILAHDVKKGARDDSRGSAWVMALKTTAEGLHRLTVVGTTRDEQLTEPISVEFEVFPRLTSVGFITIDSPVNDQDITAEASEFMATGTLGDYDLGPVTMTDPTIGTITSTDAVGYPVYGVWYANFPPLAEGTYLLRAEDANSDSDEVTGLIVDFP